MDYNKLTQRIELIAQRIREIGGEVQEIRISEDWQWIPFTTDKNSGIVPDGKAAEDFRSLRKLEL